MWMHLWIFGLTWVWVCLNSSHNRGENFSCTILALLYFSSSIRFTAYKKNHPPASDNEVWRLESIAKDGSFHKRLNEAGIHKVEQFLRQHSVDSEKLRNMRFCTWFSIWIELPKPRRVLSCLFIADSWTGHDREEVESPPRSCKNLHSEWETPRVPWW